MQLGVFIHTNPKQYLGALVSAHSMRRHSAHPDRLDIRILNTVDFPFLAAREGQTYRVGGEPRQWRMDDLQSFTPLRFMPPEAMGWSGRAVLVDPDIFAVGDIHELLTRDMQGRAIVCRRRPAKGDQPGGYATSCMLLDCAKLSHWHCREDFDRLFTEGVDYIDWIELKREDPATIGLFEPEWNDFDRLTERTRLLHNTKRRTQPWKTGLPVDFTEAERFRLFPPKGWGRRARRTLLGEAAVRGTFQPHPDPAQERFFFGLLKDALAQGVVSEALLREEMRRDHLRHDAFAVLDRTPPLDQQALGRAPLAA